ncbi:MAG: transposase [Rickettsiales bacterium]|jgi:hypothetical protein|nr:transposase [Rickettsiales bacterium]
MLKRDKEVRASVIDDAKRDTIMAKIHENVKKRQSNYDRRTQVLLLALRPISAQVVNNSKGQYKKGDNAHTNSIEGFWSNLKRGVYWIYYHVSKKHSQLYVNEFAFRYNNRKNKGMFDLVLAEDIF